MATSLLTPEVQLCKCKPSNNHRRLQKKVYNAAEDGKIAEIVEWLETPSVDLNAASLLSRTVMHFACMENQHKVIEIMIKKGACLNTRDCAGETALMIASKEGHKECVILLLKSQSSSGGGCNLDVGTLTKYGEKTALNLAQEGLERAEKEKNSTKIQTFQDIVGMLEKTRYASSISLNMPRNNVIDKPVLVEDTRNKKTERENNNDINNVSIIDGTQTAKINARIKETWVTRIRDGIANKVTFLWVMIKNSFSTHRHFLVNVYPWLILLFLVITTLCLVTGYRSSVGFNVVCSNGYHKLISGNIEFPLKLNTVQNVASDCNNINKVMELEGDFSSELYFVTTVAIMTIATTVWIIIYNFFKKSDADNAEVDDHVAFLYINLPILCFNSFLWFCASCDLVTAIIGLKEALNSEMLLAVNDHFCNDKVKCNVLTSPKPYTVPLDFGAFFGFLIFLLHVLYILKLWKNNKSN